MARIRTVKPEHWDDKDLPLISLQANLLWIGMWNFSDDKGVIESDPQYIRSKVFPRRTDIRLQQIQLWLGQLREARFIVPFEFETKGYYVHRTFETHQYIKAPQPSKIPDEVIFNTLRSVHYGSNGVTIPPVLEGIGNNKVRESKAPAQNVLNKGLKKENKEPCAPPNYKEVLALFKEKFGMFPKIEPEFAHQQAQKFFNHYEGVGWKKGDNSIVNWQAIAHTWMIEDLKKIRQ